MLKIMVKWDFFLYLFNKIQNWIMLNWPNFCSIESLLYTKVKVHNFYDKLLTILYFYKKKITILKIHNSGKPGGSSACAGIYRQSVCLHLSVCHKILRMGLKSLCGVHRASAPAKGWLP